MNKLLLEVVANIRALAASLEVLSAAITAADQPGKTDDTPRTAPESPGTTLEEVRAVLADKSRKGLNAEVKALLLSHGCKKLSEVEEEFYGELLKEAEALGNG